MVEQKPSRMNRSFEKRVNELLDYMLKHRGIVGVTKAMMVLQTNQRHYRELEDRLVSNGIIELQEEQTDNGAKRISLLITKRGIVLYELLNKLHELYDDRSRGLT